MSQFFYIHPDNPQARLINQAVEIVRKGGVIVYPTDSGYALGCKIEDKGAMERICRIRQLPDGHNFTLMCRDLSELSTYAFVDNVAFRLMKNNTPGNYTFILKGTKEVPRRLLQEKRKTIGMRVPSNPIAQALLETLGEPMLSTSLMLPGSDFTESDPEEIKDRLEKVVDLIIHGRFPRAAADHGYRPDGRYPGGAARRRRRREAFPLIVIVGRWFMLRPAPRVSFLTARQSTTAPDRSAVRRESALFVWFLRGTNSPHSAAKGGIKKVTDSERSGPISAIRRK
ncbi:YciO family [Klebsiella variicola]|uniref:YciO family n=5 Tax=Klebsiella pneumoniae complex TaxID=3390273 RepID=A0A7H4MIA8_KLEVA|nr:YciO family [Klebsiella variicola]